MTSPRRFDRPRPETPGIAELVKRAETGKLRIPHFQRSFVWRPEDVRKLADSIWRGYPIGSLLLWRRPAPAGDATFGPISFPAAAADDAQWVVDGQQRATSLVGLFSPKVVDRPKIFDLYFDLRGETIQAGRAAGVPPWWLPLSEVLDLRRLTAWLRSHEADLDDGTEELAIDVGSAFAEYKLLAYVVEEADVDVLRDVFDRINSSGRPIKRAEVFHALFSIDAEPGSTGSVAESLGRLGWGEIPGERVLQSLLAVRGGDVQRDIRNEFNAGDEPAAAYLATEEALERAIHFLVRQGVPHLTLLPQDFPLPVLAAFFHVHPEPEPWIERLLGRWLWRGLVHGFTPAGQTPALRRAIRSINPGGDAPVPGAFEAVDDLLSQVPDAVAEVPVLDEYRSRDRWSRLALLALAARGPLGPYGDLVDLVDAAGRAAVGRLVPGPRSRLGTRGFWPEGQWFTGAEAPEVLRSQCVPEDAAALAVSDVDEFVRVRAGAVRSETGRFLAARLDTGAQVRPPLSSLVVLDDDPDDEIDDDDESAPQAWDGPATAGA